MEIEGKTIVWLSADDVANAVRAYVRGRLDGTAVSAFASVGGLDDLTEAKHAVSVTINHSHEEVT